jgi:hypothetical protein
MGWVEMIAWLGRPAAPAASGGSATLSAWKLTYLFVLLFGFSRVIGANDKHVCLLVLRHTAADYRPSNA